MDFLPAGICALARSQLGRSEAANLFDNSDNVHASSRTGVGVAREGAHKAPKRKTAAEKCIVLALQGRKQLAKAKTI